MEGAKKAWGHDGIDQTATSYLACWRGLTMGPSTLTCFFHISPSRQMRPFLKKPEKTLRITQLWFTSCLQDR